MSQRRFFLTLLSVFVLATNANAVDFGWERLDEGGIEYLVQVEPDLIDSFRQLGITSDIPPGLRDVRRIRITIGNAQLRNQGDIKGPPVATVPSPNSDVLSKEASPPVTPNPTFGGPETDRSRQNFGQPGAPSTDTRSATGTESSRDVPPLLNSSSDPSGLTSNNPQTNSASKTDSSLPTEPLHSEPGRFEFLHPGGAKRIETGEAPQSDIRAVSSEPSSDGAMSAASPSDRTSVPRLTAKQPADTPESKPWLALMGALLALFASLGANAYLVWIHQAVRAKYRVLVQKLPREAAAAS